LGLCFVWIISEEAGLGSEERPFKRRLETFFIKQTLLNSKFLFVSGYEYLSARVCKSLQFDLVEGEMCESLKALASAESAML